MLCGYVTSRSLGRRRSQLATLGLALVLVLLAGFSLWAAVHTNAAARQVDRDNAEQRVWQDARVELDPARRLDLYKKAQQHLFDDGAALFMYTLHDIYGVDNWVKWEPRKDEMIWAHEMDWNG